MAIQRQTACTVYSSIIYNNCFPLSLLDDGSVLRLNDGFLVNLFLMVGTWLSKSIFELIVVLFVIFCSMVSDRQ